MSEQLKPMPSSTDAESAVISCMFLENDLIGEARILLSSEMFYTPAHRYAFEVMLELQTDGKAVDLVSVNGKINSRGLLDQMGGSQGVAELMDDMPSTRNFSDYAEMVRGMYALRRFIVEANQAVSEAFSTPEDVREFLDTQEARLRKINDEVNGDQEKSLFTIRESLLEWTDHASILRESGEIPGLATGIEAFDKLQAIRPGNLITVSGKSSHGKTAFAVNTIGRGILKASNRPSILVFSAEMTHLELVERLLSAEARIENGRLRDPRKLSKTQLARIVQVQSLMTNWKLHIEDRPGIPVEYIETISRRVKAKHGLDLVIVDYLQLLTTVTHRNQQRYRELEDMSGMMKGLAKTLEIPVIQLAQLGDNGQARGSKKIFDDSDLFVEIAMDEDDRMNGDLEQVKATAKITKGRSVGTGIINLEFQKPFALFTEPEFEPTERTYGK